MAHDLIILFFSFFFSVFRLDFIYLLLLLFRSLHQYMRVFILFFIIHYMDIVYLTNVSHRTVVFNFMFLSKLRELNSVNENRTRFIDDDGVFAREFFFFNFGFNQTAVSFRRVVIRF